MDYDLGRAHGKVVITADTRDATRAMDDYEKATTTATEAAQGQSRIEQELTERRRVATEAANKRKEAEAEYKRVMADSNATAQEQIDAEENRNKARGEHLKATRRATEAERALRAEVAGNKDAVDKFTRSLDRANNSVDQHTRHLRSMRAEAERLGKSMESLTGILTRTFATLGKGLAITGGVGVVGGLGALLGAGGIQALMVGIGGLGSIIGQFTGSLLLIPAAVSGVVASIAALTIGFKGVGDALKSMDDPEKFVEALKKLSPAAREFSLQIYQFRDAFKSFKQQIQDGLFAPLVGEIEPLIRSVLPTLMVGLRNVANAFGELGAGFAQWLRAPETLEAMSKFFDNMASALKAIVPGMAAFSDAMRKLSVVGSSFFPQLAQSFNSLATKFRDWIDGLNASGKLQEWIQNGINAFGQLGRTIRDIGIAIANIFNISGQEGGALLSLETIAAKFRDWTESVEGNQAISDFFAKVREATDALLPVLKVVGSALASLLGSLTDTGIATSSGMESFFKSLGDALKILGDALVASGPQINEILKTLGDALVSIMTAIGPELPGLFEALSGVLKTLAPVLVNIAQSFADFLSGLTPAQMEALVGITLALAAIISIAPAVATAIGVVTAAFTFFMSTAGLVVLAIAAVIAIGVAIYKNWDTIKNAATVLWETLKVFASWVASVFTNAWQTLVDSIKNAWETIKKTISTVVGGIRDQFLGMIGGAVDWGKKLIDNFIDGIINAVPGLRAALDWVARLVPDFLETNSPARRGPLNRVSPNRMGEKLVENLADGIKTAAPMAQSAASAVSSSVAAGFKSDSTGNIAGTTGTGSSGQNSGMQQQIKSITGELSALGRLFQNIAQITLGLVNTAVQVTKVIGALWSDGKNTGKMGDNPLTRPGGILSDKQAREPLPEQQFVDGVPQAKKMNEPEEFAKPLPSLNPETYMDRKAVAESQLPRQKPVPGVTPQSGRPANLNVQPSSTPGLSSGRGSTKPSMFLLHTEEGNKGGADPEGLATWMKGMGDRSYHYIVNDDGSLVVNPVSPDEAAWSVGPQGNSKSINAVFGGSKAGWTREEWLTNRREAIRTMASLAVSDAQKYGIPLELLTGDRSSGIGGHSWVSENLGGTDHTDPGPDFPWDVFQGDMAAAAGGTNVSNGAQRNFPIPGEDGYVEANRMNAPGGMRTFGPRPRTPGGGGNPPRPRPSKDTVGKASSEYGVGPKADIQYGAAGFPSWVYQLGERFGVEAATYAGHQTDGANGQIASGSVVPNPKGLNRGIDWRPKGLDIFSAEGSAVMETFAQFLMTNGLAEQIIYQSAASGNQFGFPYNSDYSASYPSHKDHLHSRFGNNLQFGKGEIELTTPKPIEVENRIPVTGEDQKIEAVPEYGKDKDGTPLIKTTPPREAKTKVSGEVEPPDIDGQAGSSGGALGAVLGGQSGTAGSMSMIDMISGVASDAGAIIGDAFQVFNSTLTAIDSTADLTATAIRGFENTEDVYAAVDQIQTYIALGADVAKMTSTVTGVIGKYVGMAAAADSSGATAGVAAAFGAASAISGIVQTGLETTNAMIDLGQEVYRITSKYGAKMAGIMLGGPETGPLGGNVRMLLNTNTGELYSYSEDNALNKNTKNLPDWMARAYGGNKPQTTVQQTQLNLYTGPGANPKNLISDTMWLANVGGPSVVSVAGRN